MICSVCQINHATISIQETFDKNVIQEKHICKKCASKLGLFEEKELFFVDIESLLHSNRDECINQNLLDIDTFVDNSLNCSECSTTLTNFLVHRELGCSSCYKKFAAYISLYFKETMQVSKHLGKQPNQDIETIMKNKEKLELEKKLIHFISNEDYENAAVIRDYISNSNSINN